MIIPKYTYDGKYFPNSNFNSDQYYKSVNLDDAKKCGNDVYLNDVRVANNSKVALYKKGYCYIKDIFRTYWDESVSSSSCRSSA